MARQQKWFARGWRAGGATNSVCALALGGALAACGGAGGEADIDGGGPGSDGPSGDGRLWEETYTEPDDFDRTDCSGIGDLDVEGIWHLGAEREKDFRPTWFRPEGDVITSERAGEELAARVAGRPWDEASVSEEGIFLRYVLRIGYEEQVWAFLGCAVDDEGALYGRYASCWFHPGTGDGEIAFCEEAGFSAIRLAPLEEPAADGVEELAVYAGPEEAPWNAGERADTAVHVHDEIAYVARAGIGVAILDVSDPKAPVELGRLTAVGLPVAVEVASIDSDTLFAIVASRSSTAIADVSDPAQPEVLAEVPGAFSTALRGSTLYLASVGGGIGGAGLAIYDVSDPSEPVEVGHYRGSGSAHAGDAELASQPPASEPTYAFHVDVVEDRAYLSHGRRGLLVLDVSDPQDPQPLAEYADETPFSRASAHTVAGESEVIVHIDERFGGLLRVLDGNTVAATYLEPLGAFETRPEIGHSQLAVAGELVYLAHHQDGLRVIDLADPTSPTEIAHYHSWPGPQPGYGHHFAEGAIGVDVDLDRGLVFLADSHLGLVILSHAGP